MSITIAIRKDGPYLISGDDVARLRLVDQAGEVVVPAGRSVALCRCGASSTKPLCDGTHARIGFRGTEAARDAFDAATRPKE